MAPPSLHETQRSAVAPNARRGLVLCFFYLFVFAGFLMLNAFWPAAISQENLEYNGVILSIGGPGAAMMMAIAMIVVAVLLSLLYIRPGQSQNPQPRK